MNFAMDSDIKRGRLLNGGKRRFHRRNLHPLWMWEITIGSDDSLGIIKNGHFRSFHGRGCLYENRTQPSNWSGTAFWWPIIRRTTVFLHTSHPQNEPSQLFLKTLSHIVKNLMNKEDPGSRMGRHCYSCIGWKLHFCLSREVNGFTSTTTLFRS